MGMMKFLSRVKNRAFGSPGPTAPGVRRAPSSPLAFALEPRFMFDAAGAATAEPAMVDHAAADPVAADHSADTAQADALARAAASAAATTPATSAPMDIRAADPARNDGRKEVVFIESSLADHQTLVDGVKAGVEVVLLDGGQDGLSQMAQWAQTHSGYDAIHVISHGAEGQVNLGTLTLNQATAAARSADLAAVGSALTQGGDLLLYGCDVATGQGHAFLALVADRSGADVAASTNPTGAAALGGDWILEQSTGPVDSRPVLDSAAIRQFSQLLANSAPTISDLDHDSVAWAGAGNSVNLDGGTAVTLSDVDFEAKAGGTGDWGGASLSAQRYNGNAPDATDKDVFSVNESGFTVSGANLQSGGRTFATFTSTGGVLTISFTSGETTATTALVNAVARNILYRNDTPYGDATLAFVLTDEAGAAATANVTIASSTICADSTTDSDSEGDAADGFSLREAMARSVSQIGADTIKVVLSSAAAYSFGSGVTVGGGDTLDLDGANNVTISGSTVTLGGTLTISNGASQSATISSVLAGAGNGLVKAGAGAVTLSGTNSFTGPVTVSAGTLTASGGNAISNTVAVTVSRDGVLSLDANETIGSLAGAGSVTLANYVLKTNNNENTEFSGVISGSSSNAGLTKAGSGTLTLSGANEYTGTTLIQGGTLRIGAGGTTGRVLGGINNSVSTALVEFKRSDDITYGGVISGAGKLTKSGAGTLTLTGANSYTGMTTISAGALQIGDGGTTGTVAGAITNTGRLVVNRSDDVTLGGVISGTGSLTKTGAGTLILTASNTYSGGTTISAGALQIGNGGITGTITGAITNNAALIFNKSNSINYGGVISGAGSLTVTLSASGTLILTGDNTYTGGTTISAGKLQIGTGGVTGSIVGNVANNGGMNFARSDVITFAGVISGTGSVTKLGSTGTLKLTGANTYTGGTIVSAGTLQIGGGGTTGSVVGDITTGSNTTLVFNRSDNLTHAGVISGSLTVRQAGSGTLTLSGANSYTGGTQINAGTLQVSADGNLGGAGWLTLNNGTLAATASFSSNRAITLSGAGSFSSSADTTLTLTGVVSGGNSLRKVGAGKLVLTGANSYSGGTDVSAGTLQVSADGNLGDSSGGLTLSGGTLQTTASFTSARAVALTGTSTAATDSGTTLTLGGVISGTGGLAKAGEGTLTLSGNNSYTGGAQINEGTLEVSADGNLGDSSGGTHVFRWHVADDRVLHLGPRGRPHGNRHDRHGQRDDSHTWRRHQRHRRADQNRDGRLGPERHRQWRVRLDHRRSGRRPVPDQRRGHRQRDDQPERRQPEHQQRQRPHPGQRHPIEWRRHHHRHHRRWEQPDPVGRRQRRRSVDVGQQPDLLRRHQQPDGGPDAERRAASPVRCRRSGRRRHPSGDRQRRHPDRRRRPDPDERLRAGWLQLHRHKRSGGGHPGHLDSVRHFVRRGWADRQCGRRQHGSADGCQRLHRQHRGGERTIVHHRLDHQRGEGAEQRQRAGGQRDRQRRCDRPERRHPDRRGGRNQQRCRHLDRQRQSSAAGRRAVGRTAQRDRL